MRKFTKVLHARHKPVINGRVLNCALARSHHEPEEYYSSPVVKLLPSVDLEPEMIPVRDQGQEGSCTSFGHGANADWRQIQARNNEPGSNPSIIYRRDEFVPMACNFFYGQERSLDGDFGQDQGSFVHTGAKVATQIGHISEKVFPYGPASLYQEPDAQHMNWALSHRLKTALPVKLADPRAIQAALSNRDPVIFGWVVYQSIQRVGADGIISMPGWFDRAIGGHCTTVFGYKNINGQLYFKIRNSWGSSWGANGYGWMPAAYICNSRYASDGWVVK